MPASAYLGGSLSYVPLWCKSNFSFLEGASDPAELVEEARHLGLRSIALTDRDGVHGIVQAHVKARELGVHLIVGSQVTLEDGSVIVLLAASREGYANLCRLVTRGRRRCPKGESRVHWSEVFDHAPGLFALWGGDRSLLVRAIDDEAPLAEALANERDGRLDATAGDAPGFPDDGPGRIAAEPVVDLFQFAAAREPRTLQQVADRLREAFGPRLFAMLARHRRAGEPAQERRLRERAERWGLPLVAAVETLYHIPDRRPLHDVLNCIRNGVKLPEAGHAIKGNAEHALHSAATFGQLFADLPLAVARTREIAEACTFGMDEIRYRYPSEKLPDGTTSMQHLRDLTWEGARKRYRDHPGPDGRPGHVPDDVRAQIDKELALIDELDYPGYFLTMREIVRFCQERDILCQGRGSAANSVVCYCLEITSVDPVRMGLLFERFISRERAEPPDIDLDIEHDRREEAIQHMYDKYGRAHAAMVANVIRYRPKSAVRDVGKALGLSETSLDRLSKMVGRWGGLDEKPLVQAGLDPHNPTIAHLLRLANEIVGFPRHLSIHPGGFLLGHEPVHDLVPIENATMEDRTVIQWDKDDVEELGLFKVDLLGLGALTQLHYAFDLLRQHRGLDLNSIADIPHEDPATYAMVRRADTVGTFQIESRAQMAMLPRLRPRTFYDLVVEISIVRPGPITGGMVHPYLRRRQGKEPIEYPHPSLVPVLEKTLGVPLFQEQGMKLAVAAAGFSAGEADELRRAMGHKRSHERMDRLARRLLEGMMRNGIDADTAARIFKQLSAFADYGFPESHAASFALLVYASAHLKRYHHTAFTAAMLNAQPMGFYSPATLINDAKRHGVEVRPIDARHSAHDCTVEEGALRIGLRSVRGVGEAHRAALEAALAERPFESLDDFVRRSGLPRAALENLALIGGFRGFDLKPREALWKIQALTRRSSGPLADVRPPEPDVSLPPLSAAEAMEADYALSGLSTSRQPLQLFRPFLDTRQVTTAAGLEQAVHGRRIRIAGLVICRQHPPTAKGFTFLTLEDETGLANVVVRPKVYDRFRELVRRAPLIVVDGTLEKVDGVINLQGDRFYRLGGRSSRLEGFRRHDFH